MSLTKKQIKWLQRINTTWERCSNFQVQTLQGQNYIATTDGHRLHAVPTDLTPGVYKLVDGVFQVTEDKPLDWAVVVPVVWTDEQLVTQHSFKEIKASGKKRKNWDTIAIQVHQNPNIYLEAKFLFDATSYDKFCFQRTKARGYLPVRYDYKDGSFAVVMPLHPEVYDPVFAVD